MLRKGAVIRVAGTPDGDGQKASAISYLDLLFENGLVERWFGPSSLQTLSREDLAGLRQWGEYVIDEQGACLIEELAMDYRDVSTRMLDVPVEIVVQWNVTCDWDDWDEPDYGTGSGPIFGGDPGSTPGPD